MQNVAERVGNFVSRTFRDQQRLVIENADKSWRVTSGAHVAITLGIRGGQADKRGAFNVGTSEGIQLVSDLGNHNFLRIPDDGPQLVFARYVHTFQTNQRGPETATVLP